MVLSESINMCTYWFMFKELKEKRQGFRNIDSIILAEILKTVLAFVDDTDLWWNGQGCGEMMNAILQECSTFHETDGSKI